MKLFIMTFFIGILTLVSMHHIQFHSTVGYMASLRMDFEDTRFLIDIVQ